MMPATATVDEPSNKNESSPLISPSRRRSSSRVLEYSSVGLTIVEDENQPVLLHDFSGPILSSSLTSIRVVAAHGDCELSDTGSTTTAGASEILARLSANEDGMEPLLWNELPPSEEYQGQATIPSEVVSLTKNLIGCGCLSLSNGIARCANAPSALWASNAWIILLGIIFGYFCFLIAKICHLTGRTTYRSIWEETIGRRGSLAVSIANPLKAALANLAYATILSDTLKSLLLGLMGWHVPRIACLLLITVCAILPLCLLKSLHVLAPFSLLGVTGVAFTAGSMVVRYFDGSYRPGGLYYDDAPTDLQAFFGTVDNSFTTAILPFVCMVYEAYVMHYNSARFYIELKDRTLPRFAVAVSWSFSLAACASMIIASFGFVTFGGNSSGFILNNYSPYDPLAIISRIAIGVSVLTSYPIVFFGVRDGCLDICQIHAASQSPKILNLVTFALLFLLTLTAAFVTDLGLINAVGGGLVATAIVFVFPSLMYYKAVEKIHYASSSSSSPSSSDEIVPTEVMVVDASSQSNQIRSEEKNQIYFTFSMTVIGVVIGVVGAYLAMAAEYGGNEK